MAASSTNKQSLAQVPSVLVSKSDRLVPEVVQLLQRDEDMGLYEQLDERAYPLPRVNKIDQGCAGVK